MSLLVQRRADGRLSKAVKLPNGGVRAPAVLTRTGIFTYRRADGSVQREYRSAEEVYHEDSLATLRGAPVTDRHPPEMITPSNFGRFTRGHVADNVRQDDGGTVAADLIVNDGGLIGKVERDDAVELSMGYQCELDETPGVSPEGERYDVAQRKIRYNHAALGPRGWGRAGRGVSLRLDSNGDELPADEPAGDQHTRTDSDMKIRLDGIDYDPASPQFSQAFAKYQERFDAQAKELEDVKAKASADAARADEAEAKVKTTQEKLDSLSSGDELDKRVQARADLLTQAAKFLPKEEKLDGLGDDEIRRKVVEHNRQALKLDDKDAAYIGAAFDLIVADEPATGHRVDHSSDLRRHVAGGGQGGKRTIRQDRLTIPAKA